MPCFHRRHLAQRSDECLQLHSRRYGKSMEIQKPINFHTYCSDLAHFASRKSDGRNSWRQCTTLFLVAMFTIFHIHILLDLFIYCSLLFYIWMIPTSHHDYWTLASLNDIWNSWMLQHVPKGYRIAKDLQTFPLTSLQSLGVALLFWQPFEPCRADFVSCTWRCWRCPKQSKMTQTGENYPRIEQTSSQPTCLILWEMYSKPGYFMISRYIKKPWCDAAAEIPWFLPGDHPGDGLPWLLSIVASADQAVQAGEFTIVHW